MIEICSMLKNTQYNHKMVNNYSIKIPNKFDEHILSSILCD